MKHIIAFVILSLLALRVMAGEPPAGERRLESEAVPPLTTTADWLQLQRSGAAQGLPNALPGEAMELIYQRFIGSFGSATALPVPYGSQAR
jgi:hypothetical protein